MVGLIDRLDLPLQMILHFEFCVQIVSLCSRLGQILTAATCACLSSFYRVVTWGQYQYLFTHFEVFLCHASWICFKTACNSFSMSISLWMIGSAHMQAQFWIIDSDKLLNLPICLIALEDFVKSQIDGLPCSILWARNRCVKYFRRMTWSQKVAIFSKPVCYHQVKSFPSDLSNPFNKIHGHVTSSLIVKILKLSCR